MNIFSPCFRFPAFMLCLLLFGCAATDVVKTAYPPVSYSSPSAVLTSAFSPRGASLELVLSYIHSAKKSIFVAAYVFTSKPIASALVKAHQRGIEVRLVADKKVNSGAYAAVAFLAEHGVPVRLNDNYVILHHKFIIVDERHVQTGSFNYSAAAVSKNAENVLVVWNVPETAGRYVAEWQRLWGEAEHLPGHY